MSDHPRIIDPSKPPFIANDGHGLAPTEEIREMWVNALRTLIREHYSSETPYRCYVHFLNNHEVHQRP